MRTGYRIQDENPTPSPGVAGSVAVPVSASTGAAASFSGRSLLSQLLEALHGLEQSSRASRDAMARYCDQVDHGELYFRALDLLSRLEELLNQAIEDVEYRALAVRR